MSTSTQNVIDHIFTAAYSYTNASGFQVQINTNLDGNVYIGDVDTSYSLYVNGLTISEIVNTSYPPYNWANYPATRYVDLSGNWLCSLSGGIQRLSVNVCGALVVNDGIDVGFGDITVASGNFVTASGNIVSHGNIAVDCNANIGGDITVGGTIHVTGDISTMGIMNAMGGILVGASSSLGGNVSVDGSANIVGNISTTGSANISGSVFVDGSASIFGNIFSGGSANIIGNVSAGGSANICGNIFTRGSATILQNISAGGSANIASNMLIGGSANIVGNILISGSANIVGNISCSGTITALSGYVYSAKVFDVDNTNSPVNYRGTNYIGYVRLVNATDNYLLLSTATNCNVVAGNHVEIKTTNATVTQLLNVVVYNLSSATYSVLATITDTSLHEFVYFGSPTNWVQLY
jgi:hypothetical protein